MSSVDKRCIYRTIPSHSDVGIIMENGVMVKANARVADDCKKGIAKFLEKYGFRSNVVRLL